MQWTQETVDLEKRLCGCKVKHHCVAFTKSSRTGPDEGSLPPRRPRQELGHAQAGDEGVAEMDAEEPIGAGPGLETQTFNIDAMLEEKEDKKRSQTTRNQGRDALWEALRGNLPLDFLAMAAKNEEFEGKQKEAERVTYQELLQELMEELVCPTCQHDDLERKRDVKVFILTIIAVHELMVPVYTCKL
jgi:hypothetical protein